MNGQNQPYQPPDELTQHFWHAWREQLAKSPRLARLFLQRGRELLERFQRIYAQLCQAPRPLRRRWQRKLGTSLAGVALTLALSSTPGVYAIPNPAGNASLNGGPNCDLIDAITAANTDTDTGGCGAGNSGADTITLLDNVTLYAASDFGFGNSGLPRITSEITIEGEGFTIARDPGAPNFRILNVDNSGDLTLNNTTISGGNPGNVPGGGIFNYGTLTLTNSTVTGNQANIGGGIVNYYGYATISNSTISGNTAAIGAGFHNYAGYDATISDSTISGNFASFAGGGIYNGSGSGLTIQRSLIAGNESPTGSEIGVGAAINFADVNLLGHSGKTNAQAFFNFAPGVNDITATSDGTTPTALSAILDTTLQVNAPGNTATHALVTGSPAVDAATSGPATDQRGVSRPQGSDFDIGAYELEQASNQAPVCTTATASPSSLWPVNHKFKAITLGGVSDPDGDPVSLTVDSIFQDEAVDAPGSGNTAPDGQGVGTGTAQVRAERVGGGNGRVYHIRFTASDGQGGSCNGEVLVGVPQNNNGTAVDDGALYDSTVSPSARGLGSDATVDAAPNGTIFLPLVTK